MTCGGGLISQWPILLLQGLEIVGKKYDLHLHIDEMKEKQSTPRIMKKMAEKGDPTDSRSPEQEEEDEHNHSQQQQRGGCSHHGNLVWKRRFIYERLNPALGSMGDSGRVYSPKLVWTEMVCLETLSANRRREYSVLGLSWENVCCHWSGHKDVAENKQDKNDFLRLKIYISEWKIDQLLKNII